MVTVLVLFFPFEVGHKPEPIKHFAIKKKPKSALLRIELLQKSSDAASNLKKSSAPVIPVRSRGMPRKMTDTSNIAIYLKKQSFQVVFYSPIKGNSESGSYFRISIKYIGEQHEQ